MLGMIFALVDVDFPSSGHAHSKLFRECCQGSLVNAERSKPVPRKRNGHPSRIDRIGRGDRPCRPDLVEYSGKPGTSTIGPPKREKLVPAGERSGSRPKEKLDVVKLEHGVIASDRALR